MTNKPDVPIGDVERFLFAQYGEPIELLTPLAGGFWSAAYGYRVGDQNLVLRLGTIPEGFDADRSAMRFDAPDLPYPRFSRSATRSTSATPSPNGTTDDSSRTSEPRRARDPDRCSAGCFVHCGRSKNAQRLRARPTSGPRSAGLVAQPPPPANGR